MLKTIYFLLTIFLATQCSSVSMIHEGESPKPDLQLAYIVDKEGVFLYDLTTGEEKKIYSTQETFVNEEIEFLNDSILLLFTKANRV